MNEPFGIWFLAPNPGGVTTALEWFLRIVLLLAFLIYMIFAFVIIRQNTLMDSTFKTSLGPVLRLFGFAHFVVSVGVFLLAAFFL